MKTLTFLFLGLLSGAAAAQPDPALTPWTLLDQFDKAYTLDGQAQVLLVARSMASAKLVDAALKTQPAGYLQARHAVYVADIEKMPAIAKVFAVPAMRSASYRILLDQTGRVASRYAGDRESVQWLRLKDGQVAQEQRFSDVRQLSEALAQLPSE